MWRSEFWSASLSSTFWSEIRILVGIIELKVSVGIVESRFLCGISLSFTFWSTSWRSAFWAASNPYCIKLSYCSAMVIPPMQGTSTRADPLAAAARRWATFAAAGPPDAALGISPAPKGMGCLAGSAGGGHGGVTAFAAAGADGGVPAAVKATRRKNKHTHRHQLYKLCTIPEEEG